MMLNSMAVATASTPFAEATSYSLPMDVGRGHAVSVTCTVRAFDGNILQEQPVALVALEISNDLTNWTQLGGDIIEITAIGLYTASVSAIAARYTRLRVTFVNGNGEDEIPGLVLLSLDATVAA